jgi:hypothetical protein
MSTRTCTVYKYVKELYSIPKEYRGAREHQVETPCIKEYRILSFEYIAYTLCITFCVRMRNEWQGMIIIRVFHASV